ncbi:CaiB/BaiF CoA transferase family protein [Pseudonocardia sp. GCM10023141]|uniref:CaiB/BaiF CoA transferase family protein n=1 Tax=Pseudonocardia sp. GCM10023141 TaxID=3252653 RepID=UPI00360ABE53
MAALTGVRVLELTHFLAGPYAGMCLADMGADVVKIEDPDHADEARSMRPRDERDESLYFMALNWGKRSVAAGLATQAGQERVRDLVRSADVVLDNYRPGVLAKLGLDHEALAQVNPRILTVSLSGFGETGPYARHPGYDYTIQAMAGVMELAGDPDGPPTKAGISYVDHAGGLAAALAVCAGLLEVGRTGVGKHVDLGLVDVQYSMLTYLSAWNLNAGVVPARIANSAHPSLVPAQNFRTADGWLNLFVGNDPMWARMVEVVAQLDDAAQLDGADELRDERYATREGRAALAPELTARLQAVLLTRTSSEWATRLAAAGVACAAVNRLPQAFTDPHAVARGLVTEQDVDGAVFRRTRGPILSHSVDTVLPPPRLGADTEEVLAELPGRCPAP